MPSIRNLVALALLCSTGMLTACQDDELPNGNHNNCVAACDAGLDSEDAKDPFVGAAEEDWVAYREGALRTGYASGSVVGDNVELVWSRPDFMGLAWSAAKPSGAVWGDILYYPSDTGTLYAFNRMDGEVIWSKELINHNTVGIHSSPSITASTVMVGTYFGQLHSLDRLTGEEIWTYKIGNVIGSSPVYVEDHNAVYTSHEAPRDDSIAGKGYVTKNDPRTGEEIWRSDMLKHWPHASVAVDPVRKVVTVGANDGVMHGYDSDTGEEIWSVDYEPGDEFDPGTADIKTTAAISASTGLAIFGTWDGNIYALNIEDGEEAWRVPVGGAMQGSVALDDEQGRVYAPSPRNPSMHAIDRDSGEVFWSQDIGGTASSPAISGDRGRIVVGSTASKVVALDAQTGEIIWEFETDGLVSASPVLVGDMIYVAAKNGSLYALRTF